MTVTPEIARHVELEGEVLLPYLLEATAWIADIWRSDGLVPRRIVDVGAGAGVAACEFARQFASASLTAVDASPEMLARVEMRAASLGVGDRVRVRRAVVPDGIDDLEPADLIWAAMVLHHIGDEAAVIRHLGSLLAPGGLLVIAEFGDPMRFLPDALGIGRVGLAERISSAGATWVTDMRAGDTSPSPGYSAMMRQAGLEFVGERLLAVHYDALLSTDAREVAVGQLRQFRELFGDRLDAQDNSAIARLIDADDPDGIMQRDDVFMDASRRVYIARAATLRA